MNPRAAWRDLWLVLTLVFTLGFLASGGFVLHGLLQDPEYMITLATRLATRLDWLAHWPPRPDLEALTLLAPPACAILARRFHRFHQAALELPCPSETEADDSAR